MTNGDRREFLEKIKLFFRLVFSPELMQEVARDMQQEYNESRRNAAKEKEGHARQQESDRKPTVFFRKKRGNTQERMHSEYQRRGKMQAKFTTLYHFSDAHEVIVTHHKVFDGALPLAVVNRRLLHSGLSTLTVCFPVE